MYRRLTPLANQVHGILAELGRTFVWLTVLWWIGSVPGLAADAHAETPRFELEEVVVTASGEEDVIADVPRNISVITAEDIAQATSNNIVDLLARESGVVLQSVNGSDKNASVDIRGMGASAANNVIVLVDGIRQNSADLTGTDFSSIALDQVERIEVLRGAGSVLYGDGAVGGVVNIITKKAEGIPEKRVYLSYGSYGTLDARAGLKEHVGDFGITLNAGVYDTAGYRDNGDLTKTDASARVDYQAHEKMSYWMNGAIHQDRYGLPGPVPLADAEDSHRRAATRAPEDSGETTDLRIGGGTRFDDDRWGSITATIGYRSRSNPFVIGYSPLLAREDQTSEVEEASLSADLRYVKPYALWDRQHQVQFGLDLFSTRYVREELPGGPRENSAVDNIGLFITNRWALTKALRFNWGYRQNRFEGLFRTDTYTTVSGSRVWVHGDETSKDWNNEAFEIGFLYRLSDAATLYFNTASSFRVPNVDELAEAEDGLQPQEGMHFDAGVRLQLGESVEWSLGAYQIRIEDELYFSDVNRNYDEPTIRSGVETSIKWYPTLEHYVWLNYAYTSARFEDTDNYVPLVAEHQISGGVEWRVIDPLRIAFSGTYVGERFDGNDLTNDRFEKLEAYAVVDCKVTWTRGNATLFAGINNLFDKRYSTTGYSENLYPMPERNVYGGMEWRF